MKSPNMLKETMNRVLLPTIIFLSKLIDQVDFLHEEARAG